MPKAHITVEIEDDRGIGGAHWRWSFTCDKVEATKTQTGFDGPTRLTSEFSNVTDETIEHLDRTPNA